MRELGKYIRKVSATTMMLKNAYLTLSYHYNFWKFQKTAIKTNLTTKLLSADSQVWIINSTNNWVII